MTKSVCGKNSDGFLLGKDTGKYFYKLTMEAINGFDILSSTKHEM